MENNEIHKNIGLRSESMRDLITKVPSWSLKWGSLVILGTIIAFLVLSWIIKYPDTIIASGKITTEYIPQKIYSRSFGVIDSIYVTDGQRVKEGEIIAVIQNPAITEDVLLLKKNLNGINTDSDFNRIPLVSLRFLEIGGIRESYLTFENSLIDYLINNELAFMEFEEISSKASLLQQKALLRNLKTQLKLSNSQIVLKRQDLERSRILLKKGVIAQKELENQEYEFLNELKELQKINEQLNRIRTEIYSAEYDTLNISVRNEKTELKSIALVVNSIKILKKNIEQWEETYLFKSRIQGYVSFLEVSSKNSNVNIGDLAFSIIPETIGDYKINLRAKPFKFGKIKKGQQINLTMPNYPEEDYGILKGTVSSISLTTDNQGLYIVNGTLNNLLVTSYGVAIDFSHDMPVEAEIITEEKRLFNRIVNFLRKKVR